uniref:Uncharacterized protein n=1 Tax=Pseudo-nitzschia delicatissima TaxID=44447 RepID=A0A7S0UI93_9STRA|mmetsp:Transcript_977/g.1973  ORF Transcript_977/g.1973 Transcript_977/m.1973 type:complete len:228 (+) Transcript_977:135-818(+)|eukprot:CAMPEP_0197273096 /NCGR_PEP_ID=MMETSP1432-20130617/10816_1 /TAXON_ID=44447 /ORGANISM="Pseudo-nitzschia delicatissima, Strain UNC1205" /LENGTH=227 /DNA_ID=CAMNT_0042738727 /DNA_START=70 /DNA_END=753 /DNA_ORIENTATION=-
MIFRIQSIVGAAMLFQIALGGAVEDEIPERELMPYHSGHGQGYGYASGNNRYSSPRARGDVQGSNRLRPYDIGAFQAYNPENVAHHSSKSRKGGGYNTKTGKSPSVPRAKINKGYKGSVRGTHDDADHDPLVRPAQRGGYLNAMHWERVPGQPIFVSQNDVPIIILDAQPEVVIDNNGNTILTDADGNEILITVDETGNPSVTVDTLFEDPNAVEETTTTTEDGDTR